MWPKKKSDRDKFAVFVGSNSSKIIDLRKFQMSIDINSFFFQFQGEKLKIKIVDAEKYGIILDCFFCNELQQIKD